MEIRKKATFLVVFNKPMIKITIQSTTGTTDQIFQQSGFLQTNLGEFS